MAVDQNKTTFDRNADVNLSAEQLSYICKYCGKVNPISASNCVRCGKRRPRNEYLNAMKRLDESKTVRQEFISEQVKAETELRDAREQQFVRMVESRVEDEKAQIMAQQEVRLDQDREDIKRATARDAVLRIIAAENAAEARIAEAEARADAAIEGKSKEIDDLIAAEREKALNAAAEKLVAERAAIEEVAKERVEANRKANELDAARQIEAAKDEAEKTAARQAVLQIIAAEKAAEDQIRLSRDAFQQAATERIVEERILADKEAAARYAAEKQAIEKAAEERIRAEREAVKRILEGRGMSYGGGYAYGQPQSVQPFAIVPYLNQNQPVYQYDPDRVVYKFVPDNPAQMKAAVSSVEPVKYINAPKEEEEVKSKKVKVKAESVRTSKARVCGIISAVLGLAVIAIALVIGFIAKGFSMLNVTDGTVLFGNNSDVVIAFGAFFVNGINSLFKSSVAMPDIFANDFYISASVSGFSGAGVISVALAILTVVAVVIFIRSIIRIITSKAKNTDWIAGLVMILAMVAAIVCNILTATKGLEQMAMGDAIKTVLLTNYGNIALLVLSVLVTVFTGIGGGQKQPKEEEPED